MWKKFELAPLFFAAILMAVAAGGFVPDAAALVTIPPGESGTKAALDRSPRRHERVDLVVPGIGSKVSTFVAYPERKDKAPVVIVMHETFGLTDWIRAVADGLAAEGFIAIAPDFLSGKGPGGGGTDQFAGGNDVVKAVRALRVEEVTAILDAAVRYGKGLPTAAGSLGTVGFCWGGAQSFAYAGKRSNLDAAVVFYGASPELDAVAAIRAPVLGLYGEDDPRVNATVGPVAAKMRELGKPFTVHTFPGAGHGFLRAQEAREGANLAASQKAWPAAVEHLRKNLGTR